MDDMKKRSGTPRPFHEWHEDIGDVLWWIWPIEQTPYVGSPLDCGYAVQGRISLRASDGHREKGALSMDVGGWPWRDADEETEARLFWTPLPDSHAIDVAIRDHIRGGPDPMTPPETPPAPEADQVERVRQALEPFVKALLDYGDTVDDRREFPDRQNIWEHPVALDITFGDLRRAKDAIRYLAKEAGERGLGRSIDSTRPVRTCREHGNHGRDRGTGHHMEGEVPELRPRGQDSTRGTGPDVPRPP